MILLVKPAMNSNVSSVVEFKGGRSYTARFLAKNQFTQSKPLYFENQKLGMILENEVVQKLKLKKCFLQKIIS